MPKKSMFFCFVCSISFVNGMEVNNVFTTTIKNKGFSSSIDDDSVYLGRQYHSSDVMKRMDSKDGIVDGKFCMSISDDDRGIVYAEPSGKILGFHGKRIKKASTESQLSVTASDHMLKVWNHENESEVQTISIEIPENFPIADLAITKNAIKPYVALSYVFGCMVWDVQTAEKIMHESCPEERLIMRLAFSDAGHFLALRTVSRPKISGAYNSSDLERQPGLVKICAENDMSEIEYYLELQRFFEKIHIES